MDKSLLEKIEPKFDSLTGVYERFAIENLARRLLEEKHPFALILVDGDNFKNVNDGYGHKVGDLVIQILADKIKSAFEGKGFVGRFGGDEFMVVLPDVVEYDAILKTCNDMHANFEEFSVPGYPAIFVTITTGLSRFPNDGSSYDELFEKSDKALYRGKQKGRSCFIIYLDEKHRDIKIHSSNEPNANSMQQHNTVFNLIAKSQNLSESIPYLLQFFTTTLMIDHVGIQGKDSLLFSEVYALSRGREFSYIDNSLIALNVNRTTEIFYINEIKQLASLHQDVLVKKFEEQQIVSACYVEISYAGNFYGYLRADTTACFRIWQHTDMDLLLTAAKAIAMSLYYQGKTLEEM